MLIETMENQETQIRESINPDLAKTIAEKTCVLEVHRSEPGFQKKIESQLLLNGPNVSVNPKRLYATKSTVTSTQLKDLTRQKNQFFDRLKALSLPSGLLTIGNGQYLILVSMADQVKTMIEEFIEERSALLDDFEARYPSIIESAKESLGPLFDPSDYPPFSQVRNTYSLTYRFLSNSVPEELEKVSKELYESEKARIQTLCSAEAEFIQSALREQFLQLIAHFSSILGVDENSGKAKRFHGSNIDKVKDFVSSFREMNLTGDLELEKLASKAELLLSGLDPDKVRDDITFRFNLEEGFNEIKEAASKLVTDRQRKVVFED